MRTIFVASVAALGELSGCAKRQPLDVMSAPVVCDSVPPPLAAGEHVGGAFPSGIAAADSGAIVGVVFQARTGRPLSGASVTLRPSGAGVAIPPLTGAVSNAVGGFSLTPMRTGTYTLRTALIGHSPRERTVSLRPGAIDTVWTELTYMDCVGY